MLIMELSLTLIGPRLVIRPAPIEGDTEALCDLIFSIASSTRLLLLQRVFILTTMLATEPVFSLIKPFWFLVSELVIADACLFKTDAAMMAAALCSCG